MVSTRSQSKQNKNVETKSLSKSKIKTAKSIKKNTEINNEDELLLKSKRAVNDANKKAKQSVDQSTRIKEQKTKETSKLKYLPSYLHYLYALLVTISIGLFIRHLVSLHPHSGQGKKPMYGDYEAQRHWMEITINLPLNQWYINSTDNDLNYWGIDYPPLSAYISWVVGRVSYYMDPASMVLYESRGYETEWHKAMIMRMSVILTDVCFYFPSVFLFSKELTEEYTSLSLDKNKIKMVIQKRSWTFFYILFGLFLLQILQPGLLLIDHGHFQYNST